MEVNEVMRGEGKEGGFIGEIIFLSGKPKISFFFFKFLHVEDEIMKQKFLSDSWPSGKQIY